MKVNKTTILGAVSLLALLVSCQSNSISGSDSGSTTSYADNIFITESGTTYSNLEGNEQVIAISDDYYISFEFESDGSGTHEYKKDGTIYRKSFTYSLTFIADKNYEVEIQCSDDSFYKGDFSIEDYTNSYYVRPGGLRRTLTLNPYYTNGEELVFIEPNVYEDDPIEEDSTSTSDNSTPIEIDNYIELWTGFGSAYTTVLETILDSYTEQTRVFVDSESKGGYDNLQTAINNSVITGTYPNMANGYPYHFASYVHSNIMEPYDDYIVAYDQLNNTNLLDDYYSDYLVENQNLYYKADGSGYTMALPFNKSTEVMAYNVDMLNYCRSVDPTIPSTIPFTWDEIREMGKKVLAAIEPAFGKVIGSDNQLYDTVAACEAAGATVTVYMRDVDASSFRVLSWDNAENMFITLVRQWGSTYTEVVNGSNPTKGYARFASGDNKAKTMEMMSYWKTMYDERVFGLPSDVGSTTYYASSAFQLGHCLITIGSSGGLSYNIGDYSDVSVAPMAYKDASAKYVISQGTSLGLFDQGSDKDKQDSFDVAVYLTTGEAQGQWAAETGYYPASKSATNSTAYQTFLNQDPAELTIQQQLYQVSAKLNQNYYMNENENWINFVDPGFIGSSSIREQVGYIMAKVFVGEKTNEDILEECYNAIQNYVE